MDGLMGVWGMDGWMYRWVGVRWGMSEWMDRWVIEGMDE